MDQEFKSEGICRTCSFRTNCLSYKNSKITGRAVMHCEEFDDLREYRLEEKQREAKLQKGPGDTRDNLENSPRAKGLCVNCDNAGICKFPGFGHKVIFCEEHSSNFENAHSCKMPHRIFADVLNLEIETLMPGWDA